MKTDFGSRLSEAFSKSGPLCVGIDPSMAVLESLGIATNVSGVESFAFKLLDACSGLCAIVKPQVAFFEAFGSSGFRVLEKLLLEARKRELITISDAKRGDIGNSMTGYFSGWLAEDAPLLSDAITVSGYLGADSLSEIAKLATDTGTGLFVLALTSNPEAVNLQASVHEQTSVAQQISDFANNRTAAPFGNIGLVIGATKAEAVRGLAIVPGVPILAPGFGFQGAKLSDLSKVFGERSDQVIAAISRSIYSSGVAGFRDQIQRARESLMVGLEKA